MYQFNFDRFLSFYTRKLLLITIRKEITIECNYYKVKLL